MFTVPVRVRSATDDSCLLAYEFPPGKETSLLDVVQWVRSQTPHLLSGNARLEDPSRVLEEIDSSTKIPKKAKIMVLPPMKEAETIAPTATSEEESTIPHHDSESPASANKKHNDPESMPLLFISKRKTTEELGDFRPRLHDLCCLSYVPSGINLHALPEIKFVAFCLPDEDNLYIYAIPPKDKALNAQLGELGYPMMKTPDPTVRDMIATATEIVPESRRRCFYLTLCSESKEVSIPTTSDSISIHDLGVNDLELAGPTITARLEYGFFIFCFTLTGKKLKVDTKPTDTIYDIKLKLQHFDGAPPDQQRIIFAGRQLEDSLTVEECNISREATIHLVLRLRGGMFHESSGRSDMDHLLKRRRVTLYLPCGIRKEVDVTGGNMFRDIMDEAGKILQDTGNKRDLDCHGETAEERVKRLRRELDDAERELIGEGLGPATELPNCRTTSQN